MPHTRTGSKQLLHDINQSIVLNLIAIRGPISRTDITQESGLPAATVTRITRRLVEAGLVSEEASEESSGGRPPILLHFNPKVGYVVGVKLREDSMTLAICDLSCSVVYAQEAPFASGSAPYQGVNAIASTVEQVLKEHAIPLENVLGVGIGLAGLIDSEKGVCRYSAILNWRDVELAAALEYKLRVPVRVDNDVNTLAVAEQLFGVGRAGVDFVLVTVGRGIGLGISLKGEIYRGALGGAGEFGHITMDLSDEAPLCNCGKRGCLEAIASDYGILRAALGRDPGHHVEDAMSALIERAAHDEAIRALFTRAGRALGVALANLINIFDPKMVILSGEGIRAGDLLLGPLRETMPRHMFGRSFDESVLDIQPANETTWARGAASLILQEVFHPPIYESEDAVIIDNLLTLAQRGAGKRKKKPRARA